ncbi:MAG: 3'-5' exoribonuclease [Actinomycetota bacterium]|nr:3'-5' exoribonuclease [Actinomycetota bacterium]
MRFFYDCEFGRTAPDVPLISIGVVAEDGREFYAVSNAFDPLAVHPWVRDNVLPHLPPASTWLAPAVIRTQLETFLGDQPVLWAWFGAYDHVALCQLWGQMPDLPRAMPRFTLDVRQLWEHLGRPPLPAQPGRLHDALADARHVRTRWEVLAERAYQLGLAV